MSALLQDRINNCTKRRAFSWELLCVVIDHFSLWSHLYSDMEECDSPFSFYPQIANVIFRLFIKAATLQRFSACIIKLTFFRSTHSCFYCCLFIQQLQREWIIQPVSLNLQPDITFWLLFILMRFAKYNKLCSCNDCMRRPLGTLGKVSATCKWEPCVKCDGSAICNLHISRLWQTRSDPELFLLLCE